jgi:RNase P subunit RPR2
MDKVAKAWAEVERIKALIRTARNDQEKGLAVFALLDAEKRYSAELRAEKTPRTLCAACGKRLRKGEPLVAQQTHGRGLNWAFLCLRCDRKKDLPYRSNLRIEFWYVSDLKRLALHPCPSCERPMYFSRYTDRPVPCSYQCAYRHKIAKQLEHRRVQPTEKICARCQKSFVPKRADAVTCSNRCRQALHRAREITETLERGRALVKAAKGLR